MRLRHVICAVILIFLSLTLVPLNAPHPTISYAQVDITVPTNSESLRFSLEMPIRWFNNTSESAWGYENVFPDEVIHLSPSAPEFALAPDAPAQAERLTAYAIAYDTISQSPDEILSAYFAEVEGEIEFFEANGLPAARHQDRAHLSRFVTVPATYGGETVIVGDGFLYIVSYIAPTVEGLEKTQTIAASLKVNKPDDLLAVSRMSARANFAMDYGVVELNVFPYWLQTPSGRAFNGLFAEEGLMADTRYQIIFPEPQADVINYYLTGDPSQSIDLGGAVIQISAHPYDVLFGDTVEGLASDEQREAAARSILTHWGTIEEVNTLNLSKVAGLSVFLTDVFQGDNRAAAIVLDAPPYLYVLLIAAPADTWESTYVEFANNWLGTLQVRPQLWSSDGTLVGVREGLPAPDFTITTLDGQTLNLSDLRGRPVLLNFWATWCGPCRREMPTFQEYYGENSDDVVILAVDYLESDRTVQGFVDEFGLTFTIGMDYTGAIAALYNVQAFPTTIMIDKNGIITYAPPPGTLPTVGLLDRWFAREWQQP